MLFVPLCPACPQKLVNPAVAPHQCRVCTLLFAPCQHHATSPANGDSSNPQSLAQAGRKAVSVICTMVSTSQPHQFRHRAQSFGAGLAKDRSPLYKARSGDWKNVSWASNACNELVQASGRCWRCSSRTSPPGVPPSPAGQKRHGCGCLLHCAASPPRASGLGFWKHGPSPLLFCHNVLREPPQRNHRPQQPSGSSHIVRVAAPRRCRS